MGEKREGDVRVTLVICLFFTCILAGGVLLGLYIFLPETQSSPWYYLAGIILEAIPWAFWIFAYIYTCLKPRGGGGGGVGGGGGRISLKDGGRGWKPHSSRTNSGATAADEGPGGPTSPAGNGPKHVHFGEVVVMENMEDHGSSSGGQERGDHSLSNDRDNHP
ncbi:hypothetical protein SAY87_022824 [Trapa incisa]|uniref:Uncharacterized protein n=1 Tax=Trapa incisa TaxID=236973 RepID=A0AAN7Q5A9_9MYRT|nr:hypothetical protein SAY87_022824 [Trapa incisa]